jgi:cytochrome c peroxidase
MRPAVLVAGIAAAGLALTLALRPPAPLTPPIANDLLAHGGNPHAARLGRPKAAPLSAMAELGRQLFFDPGSQVVTRASPGDMLRRR